MAGAGAWRSVGAAVAAFLGYGAWAWYANADFGTDAAAMAACVQGSYSFLLTFFMTLIMESVFSRTGSVLLTTLPVCVGVVSLSYTVNFVAGTPAIILTILPGAIISTVYTVAYTLGLRRLKASASGLSPG